MSGYAQSSPVKNSLLNNNWVHFLSIVSGFTMRRTLLLFILFFFLVSTVQATTEQQLDAIGQQKDKTLAITELKTLLENKKLSNKQRFNALMQQSKTYLELSELSNAFVVAQQAKQLASQTSLLLQQAQANKLLGIVCYYQGQYSQALAFYQAALTYFKKQPFYADIAIKQANLLNNIALVQTSQGEAVAALKSYQQVESLYQLYGSEEDKIDVRYNLAALYISLRRFDIAIEMLKDVIKKRKAVNDNYGVARASADIGVAYKHSEQYSQAEQYILQAMHYFQQHGYHYDEASQLHNIAEVKYELSQLNKAFQYANSAVTVSQKINHQKAHAGSLHTLAKIFFYQGNIEQAQLNSAHSNNIAQQMGYQELINENKALMSLIYATKGQTKQALTTQLAYQKARLKLSNDQLNESIAQFESDQLIQQVKNLQQNDKLQQLEITKNDQQQQLFILGVVLLLTILFIIYRRHLENRLTKELEQRVKQRTEALEFLTQELQNANRIKSQFLANMSHEIRTPLTAVIGQAEAIIYGDFDDKSITKEVEVIHNNSLHLLQLINDILDLSKIEANKFELENKQQNLHDIVNKLNDIFTEQAQRKNLSFTITHRLPNPFIIDVDGLRLKQILINLCSNAIKFTSEGWVTLDIAIIDKTLLFTVTDTGIGMSEEQIAKVFNIFTQADNSISRRFSGSGLGLFLSDQLAKVMSGNISATSQVNHGSTFVLKLPFGEIYPNLANVDPIDNKLPATARPQKHYVGQILLADDHDDNRRLIARLLNTIGLNVIEACNGKEAVELFIAHQPELLLLDIQMPEMDGIQTLEKLRELGCNQPIYALTANAMSHEIAHYLELGFSGHLKKPIERETFLATITQYYPEVSDTAKNVSNLDELDISELVTAFIEQLKQDQQQIAYYSQQQDIKNLAKVAHKIAGAAKMFGFAELAQSAIELENAIKQQQLTMVAELTDCLLDEINVAQHQHNKHTM